MKRYLIIRYFGIDDKLEFEIGSTELERGTEEFRDWLDDFDHNLCALLVKEIDGKMVEDLERLLAELKD